MKCCLTSFLAVFFIALSGCRDKGTEPVDNTPPGRRDYTWTVDTLRARPGDLIWLWNLWGSSAADVWAVGHADASDLARWHYNGSTWTRDSTRLSSNLQCVFGFAQNDVWLCDSPGGFSNRGLQ